MIDGLVETKRTELLEHINENFAFIDFEFTCQEENNGKLAERSKRELLSVGLLIVRLEKEENDVFRFNIIDQYEQIMKPLVDPVLSKYCTDLTGITTEQAKSAMHTDAVLLAVKRILQKYNVVRLFNWGERDKQILGNALYHLYCHGKNREDAIYIHQYIYNVEKEIRSAYDPSIKKAEFGLKKIFRLSCCSVEWQEKTIDATNIDAIKVHSPVMDCIITAAVAEKYLNHDDTLKEAVKSCIGDIKRQRAELRQKEKQHQ